MKVFGRKYAVLGLLFGLLLSPMIEAKTYRLMRTIPNRVPLSFIGSDGKATGFETELMQEIVKRANLTVQEEFVSNLDSALKQLAEGKVDLVLAAASITKEREKLFDFSEPYFHTTPVAIISRNKDLKSFVELRYEVVSVEQGTTHAKRLQALQKNAGNKGEIKTTDTVFLALKDVIQGKSQAVVGDEAYMVGFMEAYQQHGLHLLIDESFADDDYGVAFKKGDAELKAKVDAALQAMKKDGSYKKLVQKWYPNRAM